MQARFAALLDREDDLIRHNRKSKLLTRRAAWSTVIVAAVFVVLLSCSADAPQDAPAQVATPEADSPFAKLMDPGGCVIEQITTADHDEYQVQGASPDGNLLLMAASLDGAAENDTVYEVY